MHRGRVFAGWILLAATSAGVAFAAPPSATVGTAVPSSVPAAPRKMESKELDALVQQGTEALAAGDAKVARDAFLDVVQADAKNAKALHGLAIAYYALNDVTKAAATIDRAVAVPGALDHAMAVNAGTIQLAAKSPMRAAKIAKDYLTAKPNPVDEPVANVLLLALDRADAQARKNAFYADAKAFYLNYVKRMETANPGYMRFGAQWLPSDKVLEFNRTNATHQPVVDRTTKELADMEASLVTKRDQLAQVNFKIERGYVERWAGDQLQNEIRELEQKRDEKKKVLDETSAKLIKPAALPELNATVAMTTSVPPLSKPAMETSPQPPVVVAVNDPQPATGTEGPTTRRSKRFRRPPGDEGQPEQPGTGQPAGGQPSTVNPPMAPNNPPLQPPQAPANPPVADPPQAQNPPEQPQPAAPKQKVKLTIYAAAFAVSHDLVVTTAAAVDGGSKISLQTRDGNAITGEVVRVDATSGLALVRVKGAKLSHLDLGTPEAGKVTCLAFADSNIFAPTAELLPGTAGAPAPQWMIKFTRHPRLAGAPLLQNNKIVGVAMGDRDSDMASYPAVPVEAVRTLVGADGPKNASILLDPLYAMLQVSVTKEREQ